MSGILGVWNLDGRPVEREVLEKMAATLVHRGPDGCFYWSDGPAGLACQQLKVTPESLKETQPLRGPSGAVVVFDGRLDNREELLEDLPEAKVARDAPDPELVLAAYQAYGDQLPERLNGEFALAVFDPARGQLLLARDAVGLRPLYYAQTGQTIIFGSEVKALLAHPQCPRKPNDDVLAWFMLKQPALDTKGLTFFDGVMRVRSGHVVVARPEGLSSRRSWDFDRGKRLELGSFDEYAEAFKHVFEQAVRRCMRSAYPVGISVSGGLDSSSIFCAAHRMRRHDSALPEFFGVSIVFDEDLGCDDKAFLAAIEHEYGGVHRLAATREFLDDIPKPIRYGEAPLLSEVTRCNDDLYALVRGRGARLLITGHWGDQVLFDRSYLVSLFRRLAWGEINRHLHAYTDWYPDIGYKYFRHLFFRDVLRSYVPDALLPALRRIKHRRGKQGPHLRFYTREFQKRSRWTAFDQPDNNGFASQHARSIYYTINAGTYLLYMEMHNKLASRAGLEVCFPFFDRDLISFVMSIPGEMLTHNGVPKGLLRQAMKGVLPESIGLRRGKADGTDYANQVMSAACPRMLKILGPRWSSIRRGYVEPRTAEELEHVKSPDRGDSAQFNFELSELFGLELWLRIFFQDDSTKGSGQDEYQVRKAV